MLRLMKHFTKKKKKTLCWECNNLGTRNWCSKRSSIAKSSLRNPEIRHIYSKNESAKVQYFNIFMLHWNIIFIMINITIRLKTILYLQDTRIYKTWMCLSTSRCLQYVFKIFRLAVSKLPTVLHHHIRFTKMNQGETN